jgi:Arc/MetJ-type ribon-helix-helix transcriptional regulator
MSFAELIQSREDVVRAALELLMAERNLSDTEHSTTALMAAEDALAVAAERLTRAVDALPVGKRPREWGG